MWRGLTKRCPICGSGGLYDGWFRGQPAVAEGLMAILCSVPAIYLSATRPEASLVPVIIGGLIAAVVAPFVFYPFSRTIWVALELMLRPAENTEPTDKR